MHEIIINQDEQNNKIVALVENGKLVEKYEEKLEGQRLEGNIYLGKVENVLMGMQAAFVDIGAEKNTFIHIKDVIPKISNETGNKHETLSKYDIKNYIRPNMPILVQVKRDSTNKKGARVSTHINLPGRFCVYMPDANFITVSQKIENEKERERLVQIVQKNIPKNAGIIVRTSSIGKSETEIVQDIKNLEIKWNKIKEISKNSEKDAPSLVYKNPGIVKRILTDLIDQDVEKIVVNNKNQYSEIENIIKETKQKIELILKEEESLLDIYDLKTQLERIENRKVWLKCGGFITIDKTEALTAIDVNSGKYIGTKNLEQTVYIVNKEASIEIAKQLRLRDIGGIIIIDYIDMKEKEHKEKIIEVLRENLKNDRSKTQIVGFTELNLLEMTRKHMCSND